MRPWRIAYLALEPRRPGTASEVHVDEIIRGLRRLGWAVTLYGTVPQRSMVRRLVQALWVQARLLARASRFDTLYVRSHSLALPSALVGRLLSKPVVHEVNGTYEDLVQANPQLAMVRRLLDWSQRLQYRWATGLIAVTPGLAEWVGREAGHGRLTIIPNGVDTDVFHPGAATDRSLPPEYVVFFGGLTVWHGVDCMLAAVDEPAWPDGVTLVVAGEGAQSAKVRDAASRNPRIVALGRLAQADLAGVVAAARAGLVPISDPGGRSATGLAPLKLFETLASGIPAIVSDLPGQAELVREHQCGMVFAPDSAPDLARCVAEIHGDPVGAAAMGKRARAAAAGHSWALRVDDTDRFLLSLEAR